MTSNCASGLRKRPCSLAPAGAPPSGMVPWTRKVKLYGFSNRLPSMAAKSLLTATVYSVAGLRGAAGVNRSVIGSRHSTRPATAGVMVKMRFGSTLASSEPATGRSNVTATMVVAAARSVGVTRRTRSGVEEDTTRLLMASVTTVESARIKPFGGVHNTKKQKGDQPSVAVPLEWQSSERATGFEPVTSSLGSWHSTPELRPQYGRNVFPHPARCQSSFLPIAPRGDGLTSRLERELLLLPRLGRRHLDGVGRHDLSLQVDELKYQLVRRIRLLAHIRHEPLYVSTGVRRVELAHHHIANQGRVTQPVVIERRVDLAVLLVCVGHDLDAGAVHRINGEQTARHRQRRHRIAHPQRRIGAEDQRLAVVRIDLQARIKRLRGERERGARAREIRPRHPLGHRIAARANTRRRQRRPLRPCRAAAAAPCHRGIGVLGDALGNLGADPIELEIAHRVALTDDLPVDREATISVNRVLSGFLHV